MSAQAGPEAKNTGDLVQDKVSPRGCASGQSVVRGGEK
jgi:hypothetical protein